jgi:steroid delta-isomerase-like uncharacterized protein
MAPEADGPDDRWRMERDAKELVRRWYEEMWNVWSFDLVDEIAAPELVFRGSLGVATQGREGLKNYMRLVQAAFPDFHNEIERLVAERSTVVAKLTYSGTHAGEFQGVAPTRRRVTYAGVAIFDVADGAIRSAWVLGDLHSLRQQMGVE